MARAFARVKPRVGVLLIGAPRSPSPGPGRSTTAPRRWRAQGAGPQPLIEITEKQRLRLIKITITKLELFVDYFCGFCNRVLTAFETTQHRCEALLII